MIREGIGKSTYELKRERGYEIKVDTIGRGMSGVLKSRTSHLASYPTSDNVNHRAIHSR